MAYPYYNSMNYPQYPMQQMQGVQNVPLQNQPQQNNGIIWVQGEGAAKSYLVAPGCTVALFDNESQTIYIKSADASGMPTMKVLDYTMREQQARPIISDKTNFATKDDISSIREEIEAIKAKFADEGSKKK
jgi:hypothetical protein